MTENKRFTLKDIGFVYDNGTLIGMKEIEEVLNGLNDENQALKERRHEDINDLSVIAMKYKALEEENKELKEEIRMLNELLGERELAEYRRKEYDEFWAKKKRIMGL